MVVRIFRDGLRRPSKFPKPKFNALHVKRSTTSRQPPDEVARCKEYQRLIDPTLGYQRFDDPTGSNVTRPTLCIAHTSVFDASKDDDTNTETLLENLQKKLASQAGRKRNLAIHKEQKNESSEDIAGTNRQLQDHKDDLQADNVWQYATTNDSNINKDDKLLQRPERIEERGETKTIGPPHLKPSHIGYRFEANTQLDELAKKYLNMQKDLIDNRLSQDMERLGLPIDTREAMRPSVNVNISCEEDTNREIDVTKPDKFQQKEVINSNPDYYEINWCNRYFKPPKENESEIEITFQRDSIDTSKGYIQCTRSEEMLPLNCCIDFDAFDQSYETSISAEKWGFEKHDDIIPFHQFQCMDFTDLNLKVQNDKIDYPIENLTVEEGLPNHLYLQGHLIDDFATDPNTIPTIGLYDLITSIDETELGENIPKKQVTDVCHSLMTQDTDVTKYDYPFPRDYELPYTLSELTKRSDTIIQIQNQPMPTEREQIDEKKPTLTNMNLVKPKVAEQIHVSQTVQTATNDIRTDNQPTTPYQNSKTEQIHVSKIVQTATNDIRTDNQPTTPYQNSKTEQIHVSKTVQTATNDIRTDNQPTTPHQNSKMEPIHVSQTVQTATNDIRTRNQLTTPYQNSKMEPIHVSQTVQTATNDIRTHNQPTTPYQKLKTDAELIQFINAKVMEQIGAINTLQHTTQRPQRHDRLVQMNPVSPPAQELHNYEEVKKLIHSKVLEQMRESHTLKHTSHSIKGIDSIIQIAPREVHKEPLTEINVIKDHATRQKEEATVKSSNQAPEINVIKDHATCQKEEATVKSSNQAPEINVVIDHATCQKEEATVKSPSQAPEINELAKQTETISLESHNNNVKIIDTAKKEEETIHPSRGTETMVQSCVQTAPAHETQKPAPPNALSIPKTLEDLANKLTLDSNLSLSELLRRVQARNRLQYLNEIKEQISKMSTVYAEKRCPPSDRPQSPPPPDCIKPCEPPSKPKPDPPKCPPDPPKCPPEPPKSIPKEPPKCPPEPPKCPPERKKAPCPCPPPPKCPPPTRPCFTATNLDDPVTILDAATYLGSFIKRIRTGFLLSRHTSLPSINIMDGSLEDARLNLNRIRDFEPWTPIPSWPFPVDPKKRKLQCPYHGCPYPKPGPVRPNCPELPCGGFPKRLKFLDASIN